MYCQVCGAANHDDADFCARCQQKLLVVSGPLRDEATEIDSEEEGFSFEEHLLERVSILEEVLKRTGETVRSMLGVLHKQEESILVNHAGLLTLRDLLEQKTFISSEEWDELWESKTEHQFLALEKRERFAALKERIRALYSGDRSQLFVQHLEEAEYALYAFNPRRALQALEAAFRLDRANYELGLFLGESFFHEGQPERAASYFRRVLEVKPDHYEGLVYSGVIDHQRGDDRSAEERLKRAVALFPDSFLPHFCLGAVYAGQGQLARATVLLEAAVAIDAVPQALYLLGSCLYEMGRLQQAIRHLAEAVRLDPAFEEGYHLLGLCYLHRRWNRKALDAFKRAQQLNPRRMRYEDLVGYLSGQGGAALPDVGEAAARWASEAENQLERGEHKSALAAYRQALEEEPENPTLLMSYAIACLHLNRNQEIKTFAQKVVDSDAGEMLKTTAYATLIEALRGEGKFREGNRIGRRLLAEGGSNFSKAIAYYEIAQNLAEMEENLDEALDLARRSLECAPEELKQFPLAALGWVHYKRAELDEAVEYLSRSTELGPSTATLTHLGMALLASGDDERARNVLERARRLSDRGGALEERMMKFMKDSARILRSARRKD